MALTQQQQRVIDTIMDPLIPFIKVKAVAGAGKTHTLLEAARTFAPKTGLYLAYNKALAQEATEKFVGTNVKCSTIHSLAYNSTVKQYGLKVGYFGIRNIQPYSLPYKTKSNVVTILEDFFLSAYIDITKYFFDKKTPTTIQDICIKHLNKMATGEINCSHSFYLKLYHIYVTTGEIPTPEVELLLVDECADITELTIEIFKLIKAKKKIAVGDPMQSIYSFNKTVNLFNVLQNEGVSIDLTESFRVSEDIACSIMGFVRKHIDPKFSFIGRYYTDDCVSTTKAYIARNNSGLMEEMFRLMEARIPFHTTRKIDTILELPIILANLGNGKPIENYNYKHIEKLRKEWTDNEYIQSKHKSPGRYVQSKLNEDEELDRAFKVLYAHSPKAINELTKYARECAKKPCDLTLTTAHSSKGLEFHEVELAPDMNEAVTSALTEIHKNRIEMDSSTDVDYIEYKEKIIEALQEELRLYYVAASRCMVKLTNAKYLPRGLCS